MINRRSFLRLVRNRVAAGVLCSAMLTNALTRKTIELIEEIEIPWVAMLTQPGREPRYFSTVGEAYDAIEAPTGDVIFLSGDSDEL